MCMYVLNYMYVLNCVFVCIELCVFNCVHVCIELCLCIAYIKLCACMF